jgi:hypothetical protein
MPGSGTSARAGLLRATLMVGLVETQYRRAGTGPTLIVLSDLTAERLVALAARARVIVPDTTTIGALLPGTPGARPFVQWLSGFLEGLGVMSATVLAPATLAPELSAVAEVQVGVVRRVVFCGAPSQVVFPPEVDVCWVASDADLPAALG